MKRAIILAALALAGCGTSVPDPAATCASVTPLSDKQQDAIVAAEKALPDGSPLTPALLDWKRMRDEGRACARAAR